MDYLIEKTSLMVKGKNYPEGGIISDSVLTKEDLKDLSKFLKPLNNKEAQQVITAPPAVEDKKNKTSRRNERTSK